MNDKVSCFLAILEGEVFIIPQELYDNFCGTSFYDRSREFSNYALTDGVILEDILIDESDMDSIIEGDFS